MVVFPSGSEGKVVGLTIGAARLSGVSFTRVPCGQDGEGRAAMGHHWRGWLAACFAGGQFQTRRLWQRQGLVADVGLP